MTDRVKGLVVVLEQDFRDDDVQRIVHAIRMIKGVALVELVKTNHDDYINREMIRLEIGEKILDVVFPNRKKGQ